MSLLDSTAIFAAIIQQGGFSHAARHLGLSNGMISRRVAQLEAELGVTLLQRTTRQIKLTPEGEIFWQHAQRIQQELDAAVNLIQANAQKPKGTIRITSTTHFGREILTPIILKFMHQFPDINVDLLLTGQMLDPIKDNLDLVIRGSGFYDQGMMKDSSMQMKLIFKEEIRLYASLQYLSTHPEPIKPDDLYHHALIGFAGQSVTEQREKWHYHHGKKSGVIEVTPKFNSSDIYSNIYACTDGFGIGRFGELHVRKYLQAKLIRPILTDYDWGQYYLYAIYAQQKALPKRTRLLLDFIISQTENLKESI